MVTSASLLPERSECGVDEPVADPLACDVSLPLKARFYPMGIPVEIVTNSAAVLRTAGEIWGRYPPSPGSVAATFRVAVADLDAITPPVPSMPLGQQHLVSMVHGPGNFAICDLRASFAYAWFTRDVATDNAYLRYHFLEPVVYVMLNSRHLSPLHAACVALEGRAFVFCGESGAGKTTLAYACAKRGWTYLADDATHVVRGAADRTIAGRPFSIRFRAATRELFPELRAWTPERRPNGKLDLEIDTAELGIPIALRSQAAGVVFLRRERGTSNARVSPYPSAMALKEFSKVVCFGDEQIRSEHMRTLRDFAELPIIELEYGELAHAEAALRKLVP